MWAITILHSNQIVLCQTPTSITPSNNNLSQLVFHSCRAHSLLSDRPSNLFSTNQNVDTKMKMLYGPWWQFFDINTTDSTNTSNVCILLSLEMDTTVVITSAVIWKFTTDKHWSWQLRFFPDWYVWKRQKRDSLNVMQQWLVSLVSYAFIINEFPLCWNGERDNGRPEMASLVLESLHPCTDLKGNFEKSDSSSPNVIFLPKDLSIGKNVLSLMAQCRLYERRIALECKIT